MANNTTTIPGTPQTFASFQPSVSYDGSAVAFAGQGTGRSGIYTFHAGSLSAVADTNTSVPGTSSNFSVLGLAHVDGPGLTFVGQWGPSSANTGVFRRTAQGIATVVDQNTVAPGGSTTFGAVGGATLSGNTVAFGGSVGTRTGVFAANLNTTQPVVQVADTTTAIPNSTGTFAAFISLSNSGDNVAFVAQDTQARKGIYARLSGQLINIADTLTPGPGGVHFNCFGDVAISGDSIAFVAGITTSPFGALWVWRAGQLSRVVNVGDSLNGLTVASIFIGPESLKGDTIAFSFAEVNNGPNPIKGGVYTATIPAPAGLGLLAAAGVWGVRRKRS